MEISYSAGRTSDDSYIWSRSGLALEMELYPMFVTHLRVVALERQAPVYASCLVHPPYGIFQWTTFNLTVFCVVVKTSICLM